MAQKKKSTSFKAWSMSRKLRSLIWPFTKTLGGVLVVHSFCPVWRKFEQTNFKSSNARGVSGGMLIDAFQGKYQ